MRVEYINPFVEAAYSILKDVLDDEVRRGELYLKATSMPTMGVAALVGLAGDVSGRVVFDMDMPTAIKIAGRMNREEFTVFDKQNPSESQTFSRNSASTSSSHQFARPHFVGKSVHK